MRHLNPILSLCDGWFKIPGPEPVLARIVLHVVCATRADALRRTGASSSCNGHVLQQRNRVLSLSLVTAYSGLLV